MATAPAYAWLPFDSSRRASNGQACFAASSPPPQFASLFATAPLPSINDPWSYSYPHTVDVERKQQESHANIETDMPSPVPGRSTVPDKATQLFPYPPSQIGHWAWKDDNERMIREPYDYTASQPGKELRTMLLSNFNAWLQVPDKSFNIIVNVVRMLHTASLLIDDIQDNSELRRGNPVAHRVYGIAQTINAGNYVYFQALWELYKLKNPAEAIEVYASELLNLHRGQGMDLRWRETLTCPTVEEYLEMVSNKTGGLFRLAIRLMQIESATSIDCVPLVELMGLIFQITDDYKNLSDIDYTAKKGVCEDLTEGKFSFPVIYCIHATPRDSRLLHILAQRTKDIEVKKLAVKHIASTGSLEYTRQFVEELSLRARRLVDDIGGQVGSGSKGMHAVLDLIEIGSKD